MENSRTLVPFVLLFLTYADGTHFRGAMFWWTAGYEDPRKVDISFRVSWRRTYRESTFCNLTTIAEKTLIGPPDAGLLFCSLGCRNEDVAVGDVLYYCTDYSQIENWSSGERTYTYTFPSLGRYRLSWRGKGWVEGLQQGRDAPWEFSMYLDLLPRADTGRTNSSPRTAMTTIISLQQGCNHTITIPREDPDGDTVYCRWADPFMQECGGICARHPGIHLNPSTCELLFPSSASLGWYALAIQLEDFTVNSQVALASVPLQFLVQVYQSTVACNALPVFINPTPEDGSCLLPALGRTIWFLIAVQTKDRATMITDVTTTSTNGMQRSPIRHRPDSRDYYVNVTWTPVERREHIFCFTATDSTKVSTPQRCIFFAVDPPRPRPIGTQLSGDKRTILINFDQNVYRPYTRHYVWIYNQLTKTLLFAEDTSRSSRVDTVETILLINLPRDLNFIDSIYIILDSGAVRGRARCSESEGVSDPNQLVIDTGVRPVTPITPLRTSSTTDGSGSATTDCCPAVTDAVSGVGISRDYTWLIVLVVGTTLLIGAAVLVAVVIKKGPSSSVKSKSAPGGSARPASGHTGTLGHRQNFSELEPKFR